jgi:probable HAF family extracellular repeat protein
VAGIIEDLGTLGFPWAEARAINNAGDVVGAADNADRSQRAFIWTNDGKVMTEITGDYQTTGANNINVLGEVVGSIRVGGVIHAFRCSAPDFEIVDLGYIKKSRGGGSLGWGHGLNDSGQVAGTASAGGSSVHAFRYTDGVGMEDLGTLDGDEDNFGKAINAHGHVVGTSGPAQSGGFIFTEETGMLELWPLIVGPPEDLQENDLEPLDINDVGQVCGNARLLIPPDKSALRAVLLTPIVD